MTKLYSPICSLHGKKVLLINPPWKMHKGNMWKAVASCYPSLGLALIASYLEHCGGTVTIKDMQAESGNFKDLEDMAAPDVVGITATSVLIEDAVLIASTVHRIWKDVKVVIGGVHASIEPLEVLSHSDVDYVIRGEGERSMALLVAGVEKEMIPGLSMLNEDGSYWEHPNIDNIEELDAMPMPAFHLLPMHLYRSPLGGALRQPSISLFSSRGCPGSCTYCHSSLGKTIRYRSPDSIHSEISLLYHTYGIREYSFYDDTFCSSNERVRALCQLLLDQGPDITWTCMSRINYAEKHTLDLMGKSGCHMICYGVESADPQILKNIRKGINLNKVKDVVIMTRAAGIRTRLSFMFGNPGETIETMQKTLRFALDINPDLVQFNITTPYPGTEMFRWADENNYLSTKDWSQYDLHNIVMHLPTVTPQEISDFYMKAYRAFYFRPSFVIRQIKYFLLHPSIFAYFGLSYLNMIRALFVKPSMNKGRF